LAYALCAAANILFFSASLPVDLDGVVTSEATTAWATDWQLARANAPLSLATAETTAEFTLAWEKERYLGVPASGGPLAAAPLYRIVPAGTLMVEYHAESSELLDDWRDAQYMGGYPSVRIPFGCPIRLALGQDESNYNSEVASSRHWTVNDFFHMTPKSGVGLMVSGFTSAALGFGLPLTPEELAKVNA
jgi:hypothetical protein